MAGEMGSLSCESSQPQQVGNESVAAGAGHPGVRVLVEELLLLQEAEVGFAVIADHAHDGVDERRIVVDPGEEVVVSDQLEQVHGEAGVQIAQPRAVARIGIERVVPPHPHGQDVAEDVLQERLALDALPPVHASRAHVQPARVRFGLNAEVEGVAQVAAA
jgi:hypothetical protein